MSKYHFRAFETLLLCVDISFRIPTGRICSRGKKFGQKRQKKKIENFFMLMLLCIFSTLRTLKQNKIKIGLVAEIVLVPANLWSVCTVYNCLLFAYFLTTTPAVTFRIV